MGLSRGIKYELIPASSPDALNADLPIIVDDYARARSGLRRRTDGAAGFLRVFAIRIRSRSAATSSSTRPSRMVVVPIPAEHPCRDGRTPSSVAVR